MFYDVLDFMHEFYNRKRLPKDLGTSFLFFSLLICKMGHVENTYKILTKVFTGMSGDDRL